MKRFGAGQEFLTPIQSNHWLQWAIPGSIAAGSLLYNIFKGKPKPPDIGAPQYQPGIDTSAWMRQGEEAIRGQSTQWLENALRGIRGEMSGRGWTPSTSGQYGDLSQRAAGMASQNMSTAMAQLHGQGARLENMARMQGMGQYGQDYSNWLQATQQGQSNWIASLMGMLGNIDWSSIGGKPKGQGS